LSWDDRITGYQNRRSTGCFVTSMADIASYSLTDEGTKKGFYIARTPLR
jgi:hypothetical protein